MVCDRKPSSAVSRPQPPFTSSFSHVQSRKSTNNAEQQSSTSKLGKWKLTSHIFFPLRGSQTAERVPKALWESWFQEARDLKLNLSVPGHGSIVSATTHSAAVKRLLHVVVQPLIAEVWFPLLLRGPSPAGPAPPGSPGRTPRAPERTRRQKKKNALQLSAARRLSPPPPRHPSI